ncbi:alpha/beta hydrolase family protein [Jongsikchunia kroppenstedtii]|uniref:alpha/beta hydrolase family protein n=1 Tax=Jongsikchunia kroppenstedtii TaxID=1121721 RepID=UPI00036EF736|nr:alpha/beta fold hydrolase [Jongsikchunia kroppenstedtii]
MRRIRRAGIRLLVVGAVCAGLASCGGSGGSTVRPADAGGAAGDFAKVVASSNVDAVRYLYPTTTGSRDDKQNWADLFLPKGELPDQSVPLVILVHGGAWQAQIGADSFVTFARRLAERGLAVLNIEYRRVGSGGGWPTTFKDVAAALDFVPEIEEAVPAIDARHAVVVGHSAGGQLAMWAGTRDRLHANEVGADPKFDPSSAISLAGPLDMRQAVVMGDDRIVGALGGTPQQVPDRYASVDPIQNIDRSMPVIAMAGSRDTVVPPVLSQNYVKAATAAGDDARFVLVAGADHPSIVDPSAPTFQLVLETISRSAHDAARR